MDSVEKLLFVVLIIATLLGLFWGFFDPLFFTEYYMMEDGVVEYGTVLLLVAACGLVGYRWLKGRKLNPYQFTLISWLIFLAFFFVAGEEISWGQRLLNIETTEYFKEHNVQEEINLHNLVVGDIKINKLIFGVALTSAVMIYMVLIPLLYHRISWVRGWLDKWFIPIPRVRHSLAYLVLTGLITTIPASKNWELLEFGSVLIFYLVLWSPVNGHLQLESR